MPYCKSRQHNSFLLLTMSCVGCHPTRTLAYRLATRTSTSAPQSTVCVGVWVCVSVCHGVLTSAFIAKHACLTLLVEADVVARGRAPALDTTAVPYQCRVLAVSVCRSGCGDDSAASIRAAWKAIPHGAIPSHECHCDKQATTLCAAHRRLQPSKHNGGLGARLHFCRLRLHD